MTEYLAYDDFESNSRRASKILLKEKELVDDDIFEDFALTNEIIVCADQKNQKYDQMEFYDDIIEIGSYVCASEVRDMLINRVGVGKRVHILSLASTFMQDRAFKEVTDILIRDVTFVDNYGVLNLSFNALTTNCAEDIIRWVDKGIGFIDLHGNVTCSGENVGELCKRLKTLKNGNMNDVRSVMSHIIFLPPYFVYHAKMKVKLYRQLYELGYLPDNWAEIHIEYYSSYTDNPCPEHLININPVEEDVCFQE